MALWQLFKAISLLQEDCTGTVNVCRAYSIPSLPAEEIVLCLRVAFAEWIESAIHKVSPVTFTRGLQYQVDKAAAKTESEGKSSTTRSLFHSFYLSRYKNLLSYYEREQNQDVLYLKFVKGLSEEYRLACSRNMEEGIPNEIRSFVEVQGVNAFKLERGRGIQLVKNSITNQCMQLQGLEGELMQLMQSFETSHAHFNNYNQLYCNRDLGMEDLGIVISQSVLESGSSVLHNKANLERKIQEICLTVANLIEQLQAYVHQFDRLHTFSHRGEDFKSESFEDSDIETMGKTAEIVIKFIERVLPNVDYLSKFNFQRIFDINYGAIISSQRERSDNLLDTTLYTNNNFVEFVKQLQKHKWSIYETFTLVMDCQPPMVIMKGTRRSISFRVFNLNNVFANGSVEIKVYLVNECTVNDIRSKNLLPDDIPHGGNIAITNQNSAMNTTATAGKGGGKKGPPKRPRSTSDKANQIVGQSVVTLNEDCSPERICSLLKKEITITDREKQSTSTSQKKDVDNQVTSKKGALLFVIKLPYDGSQDKKIWAISLPMIIATHVSQCEKAMLTVAWDEAMRNRMGFEKDKANWQQVAQMLEGTFSVVVGTEKSAAIRQSHMEFIRTKAQECLRNEFPNNITKKGLASSFWAWFFKALLIVKEGGHFHEPWKQGFIEGFISYEAASDLLLNSNVEPGTFIIRFSDSEPGCITLVFITFDKRVYKMKPLEVYKSKSKLDSAVALLGLLNVKECFRRMDVFHHVYPNISKRDAFKEYYQLAGNRKIPSQGYIEILNMISPSSSIHTTDENIPSSNQSNTGTTSYGIDQDSKDGASSTAMQTDNDASSLSNNTDNYSDQSQLNPTTVEGMDIGIGLFDNGGIFLDNTFLLEDIFSHK